ncbi:MAG: helix-turn-helix domain-containing protein [Methylocella sp.]
MADRRKKGLMEPLIKASSADSLLHPKDAAKALNLSSSWLAKARLSGTGPRFVKIGRSVRYPDSSLREFMKARMCGSTSEY